jgi:hypothetical protein
MRGCGGRLGLIQSPNFLILRFEPGLSVVAQGRA